MDTNYLNNSGSSLSNKLEVLYIFSGSGLPIMPINNSYSGSDEDHIKKSKTAFLKDWPNKGTTDKNLIKQWNTQFPKANWAMITSGSTWILDIDNHNGEKIELPEWCPKTLTIQTRSLGLQLYFTNSTGSPIMNSVKKIATNIDTRGCNGYGVIPPSHVGMGDYKILIDYPIAEINDEMIRIFKEKGIFEGQKTPKKAKTNKNASNKKVSNEKSNEDLSTKVIIALNKLSKERCENRDMWRDVGFALHNGFDGSQVGLVHWDMWSKQAENYQEGGCAQQWESFDNDKENKITIGSLFAWAEIDSKGVFIKTAPKNAKPSDYLNALHSMNYHFTINEMNDRLFLNGELLSDNLFAVLMTKLREYGYHNQGLSLHAMISEGYENRFHPIKDYLNSLVWDGQDHIGKFAEYTKSEDDLFPLLLRKWMIGAVSKIFKPMDTLEQNPMLVIDGKQKIGKSVLVSWLGNVLPPFYITSPIYPENKDHVINSCSYFIWEVEELSGTIRKADREALKAYLTRIKVDIRAPYGRFNVEKPTTCSYFGTLNNEGGFLNDPTGSRRFRVCKINYIDWNYRKNLDPNQLWAQAVALFKSGETYELDKEHENMVAENNSRYEIEDTLLDHIFEYFDVDKDNDLWFTTTSKIISALRANDLVKNELDRAVSMRISSILTKLGCVPTKKMQNGKQIRAWQGITPINKNSPF